eukprot:CAMPEP_0179888126 /NCGR_PEP_ID=MMETSP0982-20121206/31784_1 /TAXON_ID=483367 /ORGANISM="non described non described, Strain CCMP 2436" /LENGTH=122 /DNA_ID=CAMNT_0021784025 /DNA_START=651 /DNA_END=1020 /DNA_ORIENTATION=-
MAACEERRSPRRRVFGRAAELQLQQLKTLCGGPKRFVMPDGNPFSATKVALYAKNATCIARPKTSCAADTSCASAELKSASAESPSFPFSSSSLSAAIELAREDAYIPWSQMYASAEQPVDV